MKILDTLAATPVSSLDLTGYVSVPADASVSDTVRTMCEAGRTAACVVDGERLVGIFTQRDVLNRVIGRPSTWDRPITDEMTPSPRTIGADQSLSDGLAVMNEWWVRSVPVTEDDQRLVGSLSFYVVMKTIADALSRLIADDSTGPEGQHGLAFIDFRGLNTSTPVTVTADATAAVAAHHMRARGIGSVLVVDEREALIGVVTEYDLQMKVGVEHPDASLIKVGDIMTAEPVALRAREPIARGIGQMAEHGFAHVPLLGETDRPIGVASFRDVAAYVESSLATLG